ncbi:MAG: hypothetical protein M5R41_15770 [Bacteroidia bacterium]|nr:hypothetical protein [Bacteroidia bacterium]
MKDDTSKGRVERAVLLLLQALLCILAAFATTMFMAHVVGVPSGMDGVFPMVFLYASIANLTFFHTFELQNRQTSPWKILLITAAVSMGISLLMLLVFSLFHSQS